MPKRGFVGARMFKCTRCWKPTGCVRLRQGSQIYCAFLDMRKAFDDFCASTVLAYQVGCASHRRFFRRFAQLIHATSNKDYCASTTGLGTKSSGVPHLDQLTKVWPGDWPHGWQHDASHIRNQYFRERILPPSMTPAASALLRSQAGPQAGTWLTAIPSERATTLHPTDMQCPRRLCVSMRPSRRHRAYPNLAQRRMMVPRCGW